MLPVTMIRRMTAVSIAALAVFATSLVGARPTCAATEKRALIIGMTDYTRYDSTRKGSSGRDVSIFGDLHGNLDADAIDTLLRHKLVNSLCPVKGDWQVEKLESPAAPPTAATMRAAFERLVAATSAGDVIVIYYSGHGTQVPDKSKGPEGLEDGIVPLDYDADQKNIITGKEIHGWLTRISAKKPASVTVIFDSCHSGMADRGEARAVAKGLSYHDVVDILATQSPGTKVHEAAPAPKGETDIADGAGGSYVFFAACHSDQSAFEDRAAIPAGFLTRTLVDAITHAGPGTTYRMLFDRVSGIMASKYQGCQTPQMYPTGKAADIPIFGGTAEAPKAYTPVTVGTDGSVTLRAGSLLGVTAGSKYALYRFGTTSFTNGTQVAIATVKENTVGPYLSTLGNLTFMPGTSLTALAGGAEAVEVSHNFADSELKLDVDSIRAAFGPDDASLVAALSGVKVARLVRSSERPDVAVRKLTPKGAKGEATVSIVRLLDNVTLKSIPYTTDVTQSVAAALRQQALCAYVKNMAVGAAETQIKVRLRAANYKTNPDGTHTFVSFKTDSATLGPDDWAVIQVQNHSGNNAFVAVLDIPQDGNIAQIWPNTKEPLHQESSLVRPTAGDEWLTLWRGEKVTDGSADAAPDHYALVNLHGVDPGECIEAFATNEYVPFGEYYRDADGKGESRGATSPLQVFMSSALNGTRSVGTDVSSTTWGAVVLPITITK